MGSQASPHVNNLPESNSSSVGSLVIDSNQGRDGLIQGQHCCYLSKGMRQLNGTFTQVINRKHQRIGHLFQGRYKAILVDKDAYLLELSRYIVLNPIRANMVQTLDDWHYSRVSKIVAKSKT